MMKKAVFLDRDGVINKNTKHYYVHKIEQLEWNEGIFNFLHKLQESNFLLFIVSNQGGISKGLYTREDVFVLHNYIINYLKSKKISITEIFFCPHHPSIEKCFCRKPDTLMIEKAIGRFNIQVDSSYFVGDSESDRQAAEKVGIAPVIIKSNSNPMNYIQQIIPK